MKSPVKSPPCRVRTGAPGPPEATLSPLLIVLGATASTLRAALGAAAAPLPVALQAIASSLRGALESTVAPLLMALHVTGSALRVPLGATVAPLLIALQSTASSLLVALEATLVALLTALHAIASTLRGALRGTASWLRVALQATASSLLVAQEATARPLLIALQSTASSLLVALEATARPLLIALQSLTRPLLALHATALPLLLALLLLGTASAAHAQPGAQRAQPGTQGSQPSAQPSQPGNPNAPPGTPNAQPNPDQPPHKAAQQDAAAEEAQPPGYEPEPEHGHGRDVAFFQRQWGAYRRALAAGEGSAADAILAELVSDKEAAGWPDFFVYGRAVAREAQAALESGDGERALALAQSAVRLAPHSPQSHEVLAAVRWAQGDWTGAVGAWGKAIGTTWWEPPRLKAQLGNLALAAALGLLLTGLGFALVALYRYGRALLRDLRKLLPAGAARWHATVIGGALVTAPVLFRLGLAWVILLWVVGLGLYYRPRERIGAILVVLSLAAIPLLAPTLTGYWVYPGSRAHDVYRASRALLATDAEARIAARTERTPYEAYALGLRAAWSGRYPEAEAHLEKAAQHIEHPELFTLLGNVRFALGRNDQAVEAYQKATRIDPKYVEAHFNMSRVLFQMVEHQRGNAAYRQATAINFELSERYARIAKAEGLGYVVPQGAPRALLALGSEESTHHAAVERVWSWVGGGTPRLLFAAVAIVGMILLAAMALLRRPMSYADLVDLPPGAGAGKLELQKEIAAHRYQASIDRLARVLGLVVAGGAQLARGSTLSGLLLMLLFVSSLVTLAGLWGLLPAPGAIQPTGLGTFHSLVAAAVALGTYAAALWASLREA